MATEAVLPDESQALNPEVKINSDQASDDETEESTTVTRDDEEDIDARPGPSKPIDGKKDTATSGDDGNEVTTEDAKVATDNNGDRITGDKFILLNPYTEYNKDERLRNGFYLQMENVLKLQIEQCAYYKLWFEQQNNETLSQRFAALETCSSKYLDLLRQSHLKKEMLPAHKWEQISFNCIPTNADVRDKEVQLVVKSTDLGVSNPADVYVIAEFEFQLPKDEPIKRSLSRWFHHVKIEPKLICCATSDTRQLDIVYGMDVLPFDKPDSKYTGYTRALSFYVDKGKSRTLKRKFKPVKLTFYEKRYLRKDRKIGSVQIKIDQINDMSTSIVRANLMDGRRELDAAADVRVRVREPLVEKSIIAHEERFLHLT